MISQKKINTVLIFLLIIIVCIMFDGFCNIEENVQTEQEAEARKYDCLSLSVEMTNATDYLTELVREYVVTKDETYLRDYWYDVKNAESREKIIDKMYEYELTEYEEKLLNLAKECSDLLVLSETRAMALIASNQGVTEYDEVNNYVLNIVEKNMTVEEREREALEIVFGTTYAYDKTIIKGAIDNFNEHINTRLDTELEVARENTDKAMEKMTAVIGMVAITLLIIVVMLYKYTLSPLQLYTKIITDREANEETMLIPSGCEEMQLFAKRFNYMQQELLKEGKLKAQFLANMSHEIRTPLNSIIGYQYLFEGTDMTRQQREYADVIKSASKILLGTINNILDFSRLESDKTELEMVNFSIEEFTSNIERLFIDSINKKNIYLKMNIEDNVYRYIYADESKLTQILVNIISNAVKFTDTGGVTVNMGMREESLVIKVIDTGIGIKEKDISRVFEAFEQTDVSVKRLYGGTGLGLAISKKLANMCGGDITATSIWNEGTEFDIEIPVIEGKADFIKREVKTINIDYSAFADKKVLLVEDNEVNLVMERAILERFGLMVETASRGREAVRMAEHIRYDMIFMDIRMEGISGFTAAREIKDHTCNMETCIVALTADIEKETIKKAIKSGMEYYLEKPVDIGKLLEILALVLVGDRQIFSYDYAKNNSRQYLNSEKAIMMLKDEKLYVSLLVTFRDKYKDKVFMTEDKNMIHTLKGLCGNIGAEVLKDDYARLMKGKKVIDLKTDYEKTIDAIDRYIKEHGDIAVKSKKSNISMYEFVKLLSKSDISAVDMFNDNSSSFRECLRVEIYDELSDLLNNYDLDRAYAIVKDIRLSEGEIYEENTVC